ncbi:PD-(D/E)XK nuclease family protein [Candidatus Dependentiae bacterium]|nr:PD-(D/E)XK nuclease family protein [Candidatus Dependentiae bacterium]
MSGTVQSTLKFENVDDPHTIFKLIKTGKVKYEDFTAEQIYDLKERYGFIFDKEFNKFPKTFDDDTKIISQSQIQSYMKCPRYWYFKSKLKLKGEKKDETWLKFGKVIHLILSEFYTNIDLDMAKQDPFSHFTYVLKLLTSQHWDHSLDRKLLEVDANQIFAGFSQAFGERFLELNEMNRLDIFFPMSTEEDIRSTTQPLRSIVDRINPGLKTFVDYKTNKVYPDILLKNPSELSPDEMKLYNYSIQNYVIQAIINAICIHDKYKIWPEACIFIFVRHMNTPHKGFLRIPITQDFINQVTSVVDRIYKSMSDGIYEKTKDPNSCVEYGGCEFSMACDGLDLCLINDI